MKKNCIYVDFKKFAALMPVCGQHLPIHASLIKNISKIEEDKAILLRINLFTPGSMASNIIFPKKETKNLFIKELTFRS